MSTKKNTNEKNEEKMYRFFTVVAKRVDKEVKITPVAEHTNVQAAFDARKSGEDVGVRCNGSYYKIEKP